MDEMTEAHKGMSTWKAVGPDGLPPELLKILHPGFAQCFHNILVNIWLTGEAPQDWKDAIIKVLHIKKDRTDCNNYCIQRDFACCPRRRSFAGNRRVPPQQLLRDRGTTP